MKFSLPPCQIPFHYQRLPAIRGLLGWRRFIHFVASWPLCNPAANHHPASAPPLQCTNGNFPHPIFNFPLPARSVPTHNVINIFVLWKKHKNPRGNPKRSLIIPSRRDLTNAGKCDKIKAQRESGAFKNTDPVFGIARQDRFVADRLGTPAFAAGAPFFFRRGREENQNV